MSFLASKSLEEFITSPRRLLRKAVVRLVKLENEFALDRSERVVLDPSVVPEYPLGCLSYRIASKVFLNELVCVLGDLLRLLLVLLQVVNHLQQVGQVPLDGVVVHVGLQGVVELLHLQSLLLNQE